MRRAIAFVLILGLATRCVGDEVAVPEKLLSAIAETPQDAELLGQLKLEVAKAENANLKVRLAVLYCLGCMGSGKDSEAVKVQRYLHTEFREHPDLVYLSPEYTADLCEACRGTGHHLIDCKECQKSGKCRVCGGTGKRAVVGLDGKPGRCLTCAETGQCPDCQGTGKEKKRCDKCLGKGSILSHVRTQATLVSLGERPLSGKPVELPLREISIPAVVAEMKAFSVRYAEMTTTVLKNDVLNEARAEFVRLLTNSTTRAQATLKNVKITEDGLVQLEHSDLEGVKRGSMDRTAHCSMGTMSVKLAISGEDARRLQPGMPMELFGKVRTEVGASQASFFLGSKLPGFYVTLGSGLPDLGTIRLAPFKVTVGGKTYSAP